MRAPASDLPIVLAAVGVRAGTQDILRDVSLVFQPGAPTAILGPNGAGKSTLIRVAAGLLQPSLGSVTWGGLSAKSLQRRAIVFQRPVMLRRSVAGNLAFALAAAGCPRAHCAAAVERLLARVSLGALHDRPARRLSGGEQQRLALARALAREPEILFLDEPTNNLDPAATKAVEAIIRDADASGIKVVMATHDLGQARRLCGDVVFLANGAVVETAGAADFFSRPRTEKAAAFLRGDIVE
ncbi:MAG: ABC transporter ATP-binding protein [Rhizobiales bacterium]|nr:ABC transporter ATP-binding protein [Hyphomicrobiales bacterium]